MKNLRNPLFDMFSYFHIYFDVYFPCSFIFNFIYLYVTALTHSNFVSNDSFIYHFDSYSLVLSFPYLSSFPRSLNFFPFFRSPSLYLPQSTHISLSFFLSPPLLCFSSSYFHAALFSMFYCGSVFLLSTFLISDTLMRIQAILISFFLASTFLFYCFE